MRYTHYHQFEQWNDSVALVIDYDYEPAEKMQPNPDLTGFGPGSPAGAVVSSVQLNINGNFTPITDLLEDDFLDELAVECLADYEDEK